MNKILENIKSTIEVIGAPLTLVGAIWGFDLAGIVAATATFLIAALTYAEFLINNKIEKK